MPSERILLGACFLLFIKGNEWVRQKFKTDRLVGFFSMNFYLFLSSVAGAGSDGVDCTGVAGADSGAGVDSFANSSAANS